MVDVTITDLGHLRITVEGDDELLPVDTDEVNALGEMLEPYWTNGEFYPFDAGLANPYVGLTDAPCIAEEMEMADDGNNTILGRFWYFADYQTESFIETLENEGSVTFTLFEVPT